MYLVEPCKARPCAHQGALQPIRASALRPAARDGSGALGGGQALRRVGRPFVPRHHGMAPHPFASTSMLLSLNRRMLRQVLCLKFDVLLESWRLLEDEKTVR
jgi:hypothetical protein